MGTTAPVRKVIEIARPDREALPQPEPLRVPVREPSPEKVAA